MKRIKSILYNLFAPFLRMILQNSITSKRIKGTQCNLYYNRSHHLGFLFAKEIEYEGDFSPIVFQFIKEGDLVFEVGSNIGQYSLQIAKKIGERGKLVCVEPDTDNFAFLSFNKIINKCNNIDLLNLAVSNLEGKTLFYKDTLTGGRMSSLLRQYSGTHFQGISEEVGTTTLKHLIDMFGTPAFIKVDVEGAEDLIFKDASSINVNTTYLIEVREETKNAIYSLFQSQGFSIYLLEKGLKKVNIDEDIPGFANLIIKHDSF